MLREAAIPEKSGPSDASEFLAICRAVRASLSCDRYKHVLGVARTAERLARRYKCSPSKARVAGMLHDIARAWKPAEQLEYAQRHGLAVSAVEQQAPVLLHARIGAHVARVRFGIDDPETLAAIEHHTVAVLGMSPLEKILYIADTIEPSRTMPERAAFAEAADRSLDQGFLACVKASMDYLTRVGIPIAPQTLTVYNMLVQRGEAKA